LSLTDCVAAAERTVKLSKVDAEAGFGFHLIGRDPMTVSNVEPGELYYRLGVSWIAVAEINESAPSEDSRKHINSVWMSTAHGGHALMGSLGKKRV